MNTPTPRYHHRFTAAAAIALVLALLLPLSLQAALPSDGVVVYSHSGDLKRSGPLKFVVIKGGKGESPKTLTSQAGTEPRISPDGKYVAFHNGTTLYVCELKENAPAHKLGVGAHPFWVKTGNTTQLFYSGETGKKAFGTGKSYLQPIDLENFQLSGTRREIKYKGQSSIMKGGMGINGKYAATGYPDAVLAEADGTRVFKASGGQKCNVSVHPELDEMLVLDDTGHEVVAVYDLDGNRKAWKPGGKVQNPEWSTHPDWYTYVVGHSTGGDLKVGMIGKSGTLLLKGSFTFPHLWVGKYQASGDTGDTQALAEIRVTAPSKTLNSLSTLQLSATGYDAKGKALSTQPDFSWKVDKGGNISADGLFNPNDNFEGQVTVTATASGKSATLKITVEEKPIVEVLSPSGGDSYSVGQVLTIRWKADTALLNDVVVDISLKGDGSDWIPLTDGSITPEQKEWGALEWKIPAQLEASGGKKVSTMTDKAILRVIGYTDPTFSVSGTFGIQSSSSLLLGYGGLEPLSQASGWKGLLQGELHGYRIDGRRPVNLRENASR